MNVQILTNILKFLERAPATGGECYAWCEAYAHISVLLEQAKQPPIKESVDAGTGE